MSSIRRTKRELTRFGCRNSIGRIHVLIINKKEKQDEIFRYHTERAVDLRNDLFERGKQSCRKTQSQTGEKALHRFACGDVRLGRQALRSSVGGAQGVTACVASDCLLYSWRSDAYFIPRCLFMEPVNLLAVRNRSEFRNWLASNHDKEKECWATVRRGRPVDDDTFPVYRCGGRGPLFRLDRQYCQKARYTGAVIQRFTPRRKSSAWTELNKGVAGDWNGWVL